MTAIGREPRDFGHRRPDRIKSPDAIRAAKALIRDTELMDVRETLIAESKAQEKLMGTPNQMEAVMAVMQKRKAEFKD